MNSTTYGPDGSTLVSTLIDHGDGTGTFTTFNADGSTATVETVDVLIEPDLPTLDERIAAFLDGLENP